MSDGKLYVGADGIPFEMECVDQDGEPIDLAGVESVVINVLKPDGRVVEWPVTEIEGNIIRYIIQPGDLDVSGAYYLQPELKFPDWKSPGRTQKEIVYDKFK